MRAYSRIYLPTMRINKKAATAQESSDIACTCFPAKRDMLCDGDHGSFLVFLGRQYATRTRSHSLHHAQRRRFGLGIRVASAASQLAADERCVAAATFSRLPISESGASRLLQAPTFLPNPPAAHRPRRCFPLPHTCAGPPPAQATVAGGSWHRELARRRRQPWQRQSAKVTASRLRLLTAR